MTGAVAEFLLGAGLFLDRLALAVAFLLILLAPAWWLAGRIQERRASAPFRFLCAVGLALVGYISFVNLLGRLIGHSIVAVSIYLALNALAGVLAWRHRPAEFHLAPLASAWRVWLGPALIAIVLGAPQWLLAVSTNYWDEAAASGIHLTAVNQFSEGVFPPRHNSLPHVTIKYHYAFSILAGTTRWLSGLSANVSIDAVSTLLWLFIFLFVYFWLCDLDFDRLSAAWGGFAILLGGSLAWLYLPHLEAYGGYDKVPPASQLLQKYDAAKSWFGNLLALERAPSMHLRNADGSLSNLPWDVAAQFQQHAVAMGIAMTVVALYLFAAWQKRRTLHVPLLIASILAFGVLPLGHAVFGAVAAATAGLCLLASWLQQRTRLGAIQGIGFGAGVAILALLHGGMLARGSEYGVGGFATLRTGFGYGVGGLAGFLHWNLAGFGVPLLLAILAWGLHGWRRDRRTTERNELFLVLTVFAAVSYLVPQVMFYSSETYGAEQFTEISKFFFCARFGFAFLSAFGVAYLARWARQAVVLPGFLAAAIVPVGFCYASSVNAEGIWVGFYHSPYVPHSIGRQMGEKLRSLKKGSKETYFDASADERRHGYLSEMLVFGGSVFTLTPNGFERTGIAFRLSEQVVARRYVQNGRMARLLPGAAEDCGCTWYYARPFEDMAFAPPIVRSRFDKLVAEGYFVKRFEAGARVLYSIEKPTSDLDRDIEKYWRPRIVSQIGPNRSRNEEGDPLFYDYLDHRILSGKESIEMPKWLDSEFVQLFTARFPGDPRVDFLFGRMKDTDFRLGKKIDEIVEQNVWAWTHRDSASAVWKPEYDHWLWDWDVPFIADLEHDGFDSHLAYRGRTREWLLAPGRTLPGPAMDQNDLPLPLGGRFLDGSAGDLGLWGLRTGMITLQSVASGRKVTFKWGDRPGDVLVPGDYDGNGYDEIGVWQRTNRTWYWRHAPDGPISQATFGTDTGVPVPADYNHDGRVDLAYWEPAQGKIFVSFNQGRSVDRIVPVPPHSIPAFVNMY